MKDQTRRKILALMRSHYVRLNTGFIRDAVSDPNIQSRLTDDEFIEAAITTGASIVKSGKLGEEARDRYAKLDVRHGLTRNEEIMQVWSRITGPIMVSKIA